MVSAAAGRGRAREEEFGELLWTCCPSCGPATAVAASSRRRGRISPCGAAAGRGRPWRRRRTRSPRPMTIVARASPSRTPRSPCPRTTRRWRLRTRQRLAHKTSGRGGAIGHRGCLCRGMRRRIANGKHRRLTTPTPQL
ncbi:hypothetical protein ACQJBY_073281 [Aegilops geniculata]